jgi:hypothetical protein
MPWVKVWKPGEYARTKKHLHLERDGPRLPSSHCLPLGLAIAILAGVTILALLLLNAGHPLGWLFMLDGLGQS